MDKRRLIISGVLCCFFLTFWVVSIHQAFAEETTLEKILRERKFNIGYVVLPPAVIKDPKTGALTGHFIEAANFIYGSFIASPF